MRPTAPDILARYADDIAGARPLRGALYAMTEQPHAANTHALSQYHTPHSMTLTKYFSFIFKMRWKRFALVAFSLPRRCRMLYYHALLEMAMRASTDIK